MFNAAHRIDPSHDLGNPLLSHGLCLNVVERSSRSQSTRQIPLGELRKRGDTKIRCFGRWKSRCDEFDSDGIDSKDVKQGERNHTPRDRLSPCTKLSERGIRVNRCPKPKKRRFRFGSKVASRCQLKCCAWIVCYEFYEFGIEVGMWRSVSQSFNDPLRLRCLFQRFGGYCSR
jgi:hypothetical protein